MRRHLQRTGSRTIGRGPGRRSHRRAARLAAAAALVSLACLAAFALVGSQEPPEALAAETGLAEAPVWVTQVKGIVDPAMASYLVKTMEQAAEAQAAALVVELDTPGGLDTAMRDIIQAELDSPIPIVFYVYPEGARAASAGVYILMGSDVAAMAPQTNLGAATPVALGGEMDEVMKAKVTNDAAAYISGLATNHGRNAEWAEQAVRESVSLTAEEALAEGVIEFIAADLPTLLQDIDGYVTTPKGLTLHTAGAPVEEVSMGWIQRFLHAIANPDIAYILMIIGILGIITELSTPGLGGAGIGGVIALLLAFYSFQVLPVSLVGIALVVLAMILFVAEIKIQSHGVLGIGGAVALIAGGLLLFDTSSSFLKVSWPVLIIATVIAVVVFMLVIRAVAKAMRRPPATGTATLVGATGVTVSPLGPQGQVRLRGETWKARTEGEDLLKDERIEVLRAEGLTLVVRRASTADGDTEEKPNQGT
jgi:membrane-bound serine protease (ClpP class)